LLDPPDQLHLDHADRGADGKRSGYLGPTLILSLSHASCNTGAGGRAHGKPKDPPRPGRELPGTEATWREVDICQSDEWKIRCKYGPYPTMHPGGAVLVSAPEPGWPGEPPGLFGPFVPEPLPSPADCPQCGSPVLVWGETPAPLCDGCLFAAQPPEPPLRSADCPRCRGPVLVFGDAPAQLCDPCQMTDFLDAEQGPWHD
jgi:hypothetical protein